MPPSCAWAGRPPARSPGAAARPEEHRTCRYHLTQRGELVHRRVEELLGATDEVREVSTEVLGGMLAGLRRLARYDDGRLPRTDLGEPVQRGAGGAAGPRQNASLALSTASRGFVLEQGSVVFSGDQETLRGSQAVRDAYLGAEAGA